MATEAIEKLEGQSNYSTWKFAMRMSLTLEKLWEVVKNGALPTEEEADKKALAKICLSINTSCFVHVINAKSAKEAWDSLQQAFEAKSAGRVFDLTRQLFNTKQSSFPSMEEYINELLKISHKLSDVGEPVEDKWLAFAMLNGIDKDDYLVTSITMGAKSLSLEDVKGALVEYSSRKKDVGKGEEFSKKGKFKIVCHFCGESGHIKPACPKLIGAKNPGQPVQHVSVQQVQVHPVAVPVMVTEKTHTKPKPKKPHHPHPPSQPVQVQQVQFKTASEPSKQAPKKGPKGGNKPKSPQE